jgi:hypothetical protein
MNNRKDVLGYYTDGREKACIVMLFMSYAFFSLCCILLLISLISKYLYSGSKFAFNTSVLLFVLGCVVYSTALGINIVINYAEDVDRFYYWNMYKEISGSVISSLMVSIGLMILCLFYKY